MAHLTDIDNVAPANSLKVGADILNTWRTRIDVLNDALGDITSLQADQIEAMGTTTVLLAQWGYLGALDQGLTTTSTVTFGTINAFTLGGKLTAGAVEIEGSAFDINGGTVDGITSLTAAGNLDIGAYNLQAATLTADGLTATRVIFAGASGLLSDSAAMTFVTDTLTVTKLGAFQAAGAINFDSQNMTNVDIDSGTINGITDLAVADGGTGSSTAANARTALGVAIGSNVLAYDAGLSNLAGIAMAADKFYYTSADNTHVAGTVTAFARTILDDADAATQLGTLGLSTNLLNLADAEVTQLEAIGAATISAGQWGYLGACTAGGGQLLAALTEAESTQVEAIGSATISSAQWGYLGACGAGGGQLLAALTTGESDQLELINATTISATQWGYLGALTKDPIGGDATAGRVLRLSRLEVNNGTDDQTLKCALANMWNGDAIAETNNIAKNATTGSFTLSANGTNLKIEAAGLSGNVLACFGFLYFNATTVDSIHQIAAVSNDIDIYLRNATTGATIDITTAVDTGILSCYILYVTDA